MVGREKFLKVAKFEKKGKAWIWDMGMWAETLLRWRKEGMPGDDHLLNIFGFDYKIACGQCDNNRRRTP